MRAFSANTTGSTSLLLVQAMENYRTVEAASDAEQSPAVPDVITLAVVQPTALAISAKHPVTASSLRR